MTNAQLRGPINLSKQNTRSNNVSVNKTSNGYRPLNTEAVDAKRNSQVYSTDINEAIIRQKLGPGGRNESGADEVNVPDEVVGQGWAEVPKYQAYKHQQEIAKEKEQFANKRHQIKQTLQ